MQIKFLGTGGAFDIDYLNSAALLEFRGMHILIDCGFTVFTALVNKNLVNRISHILITHLHNDHVGSLANLLLYKRIIEENERPVIIYPSEHFKNQIYRFLEMQVQDPDKYVEFVSMEHLEGVTFVDTFGQHSEGFQTYGYIFEEEEQRIVYSGDLGNPDILFDKLTKLPPLNTHVYHDITFNAQNSGHTYYKKLLPYLNGNEVFGYHCDPTQNPSDNPIRLVFYEKSLLA
ncbi:MBL fold metallo-hydrolase [Pontibacter harenae]|uniref:MBL fold metallo-hydrolase n=1 Tax=Pontibacter harenae TaxID=2894083 RepID=UPI001E2BC485|nr:MBL fold metallo-hydrolase [Pontibacter harenae]MCC9166694.1 MBL fold metallo-hydrolase [Pontibacter harenae]